VRLVMLCVFSLLLSEKFAHLPSRGAAGGAAAARAATRSWCTFLRRSPRLRSFAASSTSAAATASAAFLQ